MFPSLVQNTPRLLRRQGLEGRGNLLLPGQLGLAEDLSGRLELFALVQQAGAQNDLVVAQGGLVVVGVGGAVGAVVAVHRLARLAGVGVCLEAVAAGRELQRALGDNLVEREGAAGQVLARVAVAMDGSVGWHVKRRRNDGGLGRRSGREVADAPKDVAGLVGLELDLPLGLAAGAVAVIGRHGGESSCSGASVGIACGLRVESMEGRGWSRVWRAQ